MGERLTVLLLGSPELALGGRPVGIRSVKSRALLCYLAAAAAPRARAELAALLWGDRPEDKARGSLRLALCELRKEVGDWLDVTRDQVGLRARESCFVDYRQLAETACIDRALRLWRGELLEGFAVPDAPAFTAWLAGERDRARLLLRGLLPRAAGDDQVIRLARLLTELDPFDEEVHRLLMSALARTGNRAAALTCYERLHRRLVAELGVLPSPETRELRRSLAIPHRGLPAPPLPTPSTDLVGREDEIRHLTELLATERLVTLLGVGGVGKTRLAMAAARAVTETPGPADPPQVAFVGFAGVRPDAAVTTLARRLGVDLSPPRPVPDLLVEALTGRSLLLVLDNLEHLPGFDAVIGDILRRTEDVRVLATSRRRPALLEQVTVTVEGLPATAAQALFAARAAKASPGFDAAREAPLVAAICAATRGLPLAIELAASLLRALSCADLAARLDIGLDLLATPGPAVRPRHAGMRAVFEASWRLLDPAAQDALAALSVCDGGFTLEAGLRIAGTCENVLVQLVDHCMVQPGPAGRYAIHPLIRQFAAAHLRADSEAERAARRRHAACFTDLLAAHAPAIQDASDAEVARVLRADLDNIRLAWETSAEPAFLVWYWTLCLRLHLYEEAVAIVRRRRDRTDDPPELTARWLRMEAVAQFQRAREREATDLASAALAALGEPLPGSRTGLLLAIPGAAARALWQLRPIPGAAARGLRQPRTDRRDQGGNAGAEAAQALSLIAKLGYHRQDMLTMLCASLRQLDAVERSGDPGLRAEGYANFSAFARIAGLTRLAASFGRRADRALTEAQAAQSGGRSRGAADASLMNGARPAVDADAANRARLARGIDQLAAGRLADAWRSFAEGRERTPDPRLAENCAGMLAETALYRGEFALAAELFASTAELAARRVGDDIGRHWCLPGQAEAMLRMPEVSPGRVREVLGAARASMERRYQREEELGLRNGALTWELQEMRLLVAVARVDLLDGRRGAALDGAVGALALVPRLPSAQPGHAECWSGLAELLAALHADGLRTETAPLRSAHARMARYVRRNPGAAARCGWTGALLLLAAGDRRAAARAAEDALTAADRMDVPFDRDRARDALNRIGAAH